MKFGTDYIIAWDISDEDFPIIKVMRLSGSKKNIICEELGTSHEQCGCVSLRQLLEKFNSTQ